MMFGQIEEVYDALVCEHPYVEFDYKNIPYIIQPENWDDGKNYFVIWTAYWEKENICLYKEEVASSKIVGKDVVNRALNAKCFDEKSFLEIANDVEITGMFGAG